MRYFILPGHGNSGPGHWQSLWELEDADFHRIEQSDWENPIREEWVATLEAAVSAVALTAVPGASSATGGSDIVLVAHSLACLMVAEWASVAPAASLRKIKGALLVAPVDPHGPAFPGSARGFGNIPTAALPFPSLVVASGNDPYATLEYAHRRARDWGSAFADVGALGHINGSSGLGAWPQGRILLDSLVRG
ncbi:MAG: alpha/beta hydrolase [Fibrobacteria bacterium]